MVAERHYRAASGTPRSTATQARLAYFAHALRARPQFIAYSVSDLPAAAADWSRASVFGLPLLTWTVRSAEQRRTRRALRRPDDL